MITQTLKCNFSVSCLITRHSSIRMTTDSIHCGLPFQLPKPAKSGTWHWLCSHGLESRSERRFESRSQTWLGSWFELRAFTCIANACALRGNILFLLRSPRWLIHSWFQHGFSAHFKNAHARITFRNSFAFTWNQAFYADHDPKCPFFRVSKRVSKAWFQTALRSYGLISGFRIRKGPNHVLKRLSERDSSPCEHSHCHLQWQCTRSCVTYMMQDGYQWKEDELFFTYKPYKNIQINLL